jgi:hypothetical protein
MSNWRLEELVEGEMVVCAACKAGRLGDEDMVAIYEWIV